MIYLVRDPRGIMQSRNNLEWCGKPNCKDPALLCMDLVDDYEAAVLVSKRFPKTFQVVRYEELSTDPYNMTQKLLDFYGLPFHFNVKLFLDTHTKQNRGGVMTTYRDSQTTPYSWKRKLTFNQVHIQVKCKKAMRLWGYKLMEDKSELNDDFNPLLPYPVDLM